MKFLNRQMASTAISATVPQSGRKDLVRVLSDLYCGLALGRTAFGRFSDLITRKLDHSG